MLYYIRDTVTIDAAFAATVRADLAARGMYGGGRVVVAARRIAHAPGYTLTLRGCDLVLLADEYDGGVTGGFGTPWSGGVDLSGGPGRAGRRGGRLTLYCERFGTFRFVADDGAGGAAGALTLRHVAERPRTFFLPGETGAAGSGSVATAVRGDAAVRRVTSTALVQLLREGAGSAGVADVARAWAAYRMRVGDHYLGAFAPARPQTADYLQRAAREFRFAYAFDPVVFAAAREQARRAADGLAPADLMSSGEVRRDFPDDVAVREPGHVVRRGADGPFVRAHALAPARRLAATRIADARAQLALLARERAGVARACRTARAAAASLDGPTRAVDAELAASAAEVAAARVWVGASGRAAGVVPLGGAIAAVRAVAAAAYSGGGALAAYAGLLTAAPASWRALTPDPVTGTPAYRGRSLAELIAWGRGASAGVPHPTADARELAGGLADVVAGGGPAILDLVDPARVLAEIAAAPIDVVPPAPPGATSVGRLRELFARAAALAFGCAQARLDLAAAERRRTTLGRRIRQAEADLAAARALAASLAADHARLGRVVRRLLGPGAGGRGPPGWRLPARTGTFPPARPRVRPRALGIRTTRCTPRQPSAIFARTSSPPSAGS